MQYELYHHGIKGQKWGVRRFQNADGSLTSAGKKRYGANEMPRKSLTDKQKANVKKVAIAIGGTATIAAAAYLYATNKPAIDLAVKTAITKLQLQSGAIAAGVKASPTVKAAKANTNKFFNENLVGQAVKSGSRKVLRASIEGATILAGKKIIDKILGDKSSDNLISGYNAYTKKDDRVKIDSVNNIIRKESDKEAKRIVKKKVTDG